METEYELIVGDDKRDDLHNKLINDIYHFWLENPRDNSITFEKNVTLRWPSYLIFSGSSSPNVVWFDGRFVQLKFLRFIDQKKMGFGAEQDFWDKKIRFYAGSMRVKLEYLVNGLQDEFLRWHSAGKFQRSKAS